MDNNGMKSSLANKSKTLSIVITILVLILIAFIVFSKSDKKNNEVVEQVEESNSLETETSEETNSPSISLPEPIGEWTPSSIGTDITFDVPPTYYVSRPVIGDCNDVVSISTQTTGVPTVPVALIYKEGCITDQLVVSKYTNREVKNGYVFQTNSTNATVLNLFKKIVVSAK